MTKLYQTVQSFHNGYRAAVWMKGRNVNRLIALSVYLREAPRETMVDGIVLSSLVSRTHRT